MSVLKITLILAVIAMETSGKLPTFRKIACSGGNQDFDLCITVDYHDIVTPNDMIVANVLPQAPTVYKGRLKSNGHKAVVILKDSTNDQDTVIIRNVCIFKIIFYNKYDSVIFFPAIRFLLNLIILRTVPHLCLNLRVRAKVTA